MAPRCKEDKLLNRTFQVKLSGEWKDYGKEEDKILKRAFMAGFPCAKFRFRGSNYRYDFRKMVQQNTESRKEREIRPPGGWRQPSRPLVPAGPTTCINVPPGSPGTTIKVLHPNAKGGFIAVGVPRTAKVGQAMLVPVPPASEVAPPSAPADVPGDEGTSGRGWSAGAKVIAAGAAVAALGAGVVGGVVLGEHIVEHGLDATLEAAGDGLADAAEAVGAVVVDAGELVVDAAEETGDLVMELY